MLPYPNSGLQPPNDPDAGLLDVEEAKPAEIVLAGEGADSGSYPPGTFRKISTAMATLVALVISTYLVPALHWARPWTSEDPAIFWNLIGRELLGDDDDGEQGRRQVAEAQQVARIAAADEDDDPLRDEAVVHAPEPGAALPAYEPHPDDALDVPQPLELPNPTALDPFFDQLARTDARYAGEITRVSQWGDSVLAHDNVTSTLRARMQRRFGDAGHGFHLLAKPNASYRHRGIRFVDGETWQRCYIINKCRPDRRFGFGGTTVWSAGGAKSTFKTATKTSYGQKASRFELWYAAQPGGGKIRLQVDREAPTFVDTALNGPDPSKGQPRVLEDRWHTLQMDDGAHVIEVRAAGQGQVRAYGVVLERDVPGVVWDGMAQLGAFANRMLHFDPEHLRAQIDHRGSDLLVFMFGGNDLLLRRRRLAEYERHFTQMLRTFRGDDDPIACLVVSPVDHGIRKGGRIDSNPMVAQVTAAQRKVALAEGCAFFDTVAAMGGTGSAARWRKATPPLLAGDLSHLTHAGQAVIGQYVYLALMQAYRDYRRRIE